MYTNRISVNLGILVPFEATLDKFSANVTSGGVWELSAAYTFPSPGVILPAWTTRNTGRIDNVKANPNLWKVFNQTILDVSSVDVEGR